MSSNDETQDVFWFLVIITVVVVVGGAFLYATDTHAQDQTKLTVNGRDYFLDSVTVRITEDGWVLSTMPDISGSTATRPLPPRPPVRPPTPVNPTNPGNPLGIDPDLIRSIEDLQQGTATPCVRINGQPINFPSGCSG